MGALMVCPFLFNPHQFAWNDFFIDYREYLRWLSRGNTRSHSASWIGFCRLSRTRITGFKRKQLGDPSSKLSGDVPRAHLTNIFFSEIVGPIVLVSWHLRQSVSMLVSPVPSSAWPAAWVQFSACAARSSVQSSLPLHTPSPSLCSSRSSRSCSSLRHGRSRRLCLA